MLASALSGALFSSLVPVLGWVAAVIGAGVTLPQVLRMLRSRSAAGVSVLAWQIALGANIGWTTHGLLGAHVNIWSPNLILLGCTVFILTVIRRERGLSWVTLLGPGLLLGTTMTGLDLVLGPMAFAVAAFLPSALSQLAQFRDLVWSVNISGVSPAFLGLSVVNQIIWLIWSLGSGEASVTMVSSSIGALMAINFGWLLLRRLRVVRPTLATF